MKIALVGMADFNDNIPDDYEIWVIARYISHFPKYDRAFECHDRKPTDVLKMIADEPWFYVPEHLAHIYPKAQKIPTRFLGERFFPSFGSTISYMIAMAVYEMPYQKVSEIALYGVGMADEYEGQRPSAFYWLGVANGLGIKTSGLLTEEMYGIKLWV